MKTYRLILVAVLLLGFSFACGGDDNPMSSGSAMSDLAGTWNAVKQEFTNKANTSQKIDQVADGIAGITLNIQSSGSIELVASLFGTPFISLDGTARVEGKKLIVSFDGLGEVEYEYTLAANRLTTTDNNATYDFDGDGSEEPAIEVTVYEKG
jgi:hypothetical protein